MPNNWGALPKTYTAEQQRVINYPREGGVSLLVRGLAGTGKSTALVARLAALLREGRRPSEMLVLVPQRAWAERYERVIAQLDAPSRGGVDVVTYYGLSRRDVSLFWPLVARAAGFAHPEREPTFLTIETAQFYMWRIVEPLMAEKGYFSDLVMRHGRLLSQLIDNLNKAALAGFDYTTLNARLRGAWTGSPEHTTRFVQAQDCAIRFREHCLAHNLLDFSLVTEVYSRHLLADEVYQRYFRAHYRHLLVDNLEENVPVAHDLVAWALTPGDAPPCASAVLALDEGGGYRVFLGADPQSAEQVAGLCQETLRLETQLETTHDALALAGALGRALGARALPASGEGLPAQAVRDQFGGKYWISMIRWVAQQSAELVAQGTPADEIALIAPYVSDVMRFAIQEEFNAAGIALRLLRPSTALRDDPITRGLLMLTLLGHPHWEIRLQGGASAATTYYQWSTDDVALALQIALADLDPIRARALAQAALPPGERVLRDLSRPGEGGIGPRELARLWEEVGFQVRANYETLRTWLVTYQAGPAESVDLFLTRLFGELLSQPGYGFCANADRARTYGRLVESAAKFRAAVEEDSAAGVAGDELARAYVQLILGGIASAEYLVDRPQRLPNGVLLAPAYTYLTRDIRSRYQFWLDLGSDGWLNRPQQPLTHPYVLSRSWPPGKPWSDVEEETAKRDNLVRVLRGLAARCTGGIYLAYSELGVGGDEQAGRLLRALLVALSRKG